MDRNDDILDICTDYNTSLSARRAWIEIDCPNATKPISGVALRKESVDRNAGWYTLCADKLSRSPQGERG